MVPKKLIISCYGPADAPTTWLAMQSLHDGHLTCVFDPAGKLLVARKKTQQATVDLGNWSWPGVYNCLHTANGVKPPKKLGATTLCLTNSKQSPLAREASISMITSGNRFFGEDYNTYSRLSQLAVVDILYAGLIVMRGPQHQDKLDSRNRTAKA